MDEPKPLAENENRPMGILSHRVFHNEMMDIERDISDVKYADKKEFGLVQKIVFGIVTLALITVFGAILTLVVK
jgi:hypothetical protein